LYRPVDEPIVKRLIEISGPKAVFNDQETKEKYSHDETVGLSHAPEAVVLPGAPDEIREILRLANSENIPLTPRGLGTGLSGGAVPVHGGIVMSLERMDRIIDIDRDNLMVITEPGIITGQLQETVEAEGLFYPPDPASLDSCSIGGNVAEGAGGSRAVRYGTTKDYVSGLDLVLPDGETMQTGGKVVKDVTGYNLNQLMIGSEGTLSVVTRITLRLIPLPKLRMDLLVPYGSLDDAARTVSEIIGAKIVPTAIEFMEKNCFDLAEEFTKKKVSFRNAAAHLLITLDGNHQEAMEESRDQIGEICERNNALDVFVATNSSARERMWESRKCMFEAANAIGGMYVSLDVVVPRSSIPPLVERVQTISEKYEIKARSFGHAGDGNVHVLMFKGELADGEWEQRIGPAQSDLYAETVKLGGKITAEHGIGLLRKSYLSMNLEPSQIDVIKRLKRAFDPRNILNPGKIFDM
jgi:glycolate oxidase